MAAHHILIIEDDPDLSALLHQDLEDAEYCVTLAGSVVQGLTVVRGALPELILLDLGLPDGDGRQVLTRVRRNHDLPIIVLTARDVVVEKVELLELGAADYIVKPFHLNELLARIEVQFRRGVGEVLALGELEVHPDKRLALYRGQELPFSPKEFELLTHLMRQPGRVHSRAELIRDLWGTLPEHSNVIDVHFVNIRSKFQDVELFGLLRAVRGYGYALKAWRDFVNALFLRVCTGYRRGTPEHRLFMTGVCRWRAPYSSRS